MTIDEFMTDVAPKMRKGYVFCDVNSWHWATTKPIVLTATTPFGRNYECFDRGGSSSVDMFDIEPLVDWKNSIREVGNDKI